LVTSPLLDFIQTEHIFLIIDDDDDNNNNKYYYHHHRLELVMKCHSSE